MHSITIKIFYLYVKLFVVFWMLYSSLWVVQKHLLEQTEGSDTSARKIQTPGNHPKVILKHFIFFRFHELCHLLCSFAEINFRIINIFKHFVIPRGWTVGRPQSPVITQGNVTYMLPSNILSCDSSPANESSAPLNTYVLWRGIQIAEFRVTSQPGTKRKRGSEDMGMRTVAHHLYSHLQRS